MTVGGNFGPLSVSATQNVSPRTGEYWDGNFAMKPARRFRAPGVFADFKRYNFFAYWSAGGKNIDVNSSRGTALIGGWEFIHREGRPNFHYFSHYHSCSYSKYNGCPREQYYGDET